MLSKHLSAVLLCATMLSARPAAAQEALPHARAGRIAGTVALDGRLDEPFWKDAPAH